MPRLEDVIITHRNDQQRQYPGADYRSNLAIFHAKSGLGPLPPIDPSNMGPDALARIDLGRWLVNCNDCASAVIVDDEDLFFLCPSCGTGGNWRKVIMPGERTDIEEIMMLRPGFRMANLNRFWSPGESVEKLLAENVEHGAPIPERLRGRFEAALLEALAARDGS